MLTPGADQLPLPLSLQRPLEERERWSFVPTAALRLGLRLGHELRPREQPALRLACCSRVSVRVTPGRDEGWTVNRKRVQRLWREEGLRVPAKRRKRQRLGHSAVPAARLRAERPNHVWALDFQFDQTADGRILKLLNSVDEHTREALAVVAARSITAAATASTLEGIVARRGTAPAYIRCDNGSELTANARRDWCRFSGTGSSYIEPGAPWENPYVESFNGRLRDEFLAVEQFDSLLEAQVLLEDWRIEYNTKRPHSSLGWLPPAAYAERWEAQLHAGLS